MHFFKTHLNNNLPCISVSHMYLSPSAFYTNIVDAFLSPMLVPCATPILYSLISSSSYLVTSINNKASPYVTFLSLVLLPLSPVKIFSVASCSPTPYNRCSCLNIRNQAWQPYKTHIKRSFTYFYLYIFRWVMGSEKILNWRAASILQI